jgi:hypothetical protein
VIQFFVIIVDDGERLWCSEEDSECAKRWLLVLNGAPTRSCRSEGFCLVGSLAD